MPCGSTREACVMAACTSTAAPSSLRLRSNSRVICVLPSEFDEVIEFKPAMVENWFSSGVATAEAMVSGLAPGRLAVTSRVGKSTLGRSLTARDRYATPPNSAMAAISRLVAIGRSMNVWEIFMRQQPSLVGQDGILRASWQPALGGHWQTSAGGLPTRRRLPTYPTSRHFPSLYFASLIGPRFGGGSPDGISRQEEDGRHGSRRERGPGDRGHYLCRSGGRQRSAGRRSGRALHRGGSESGTEVRQRDRDGPRRLRAAHRQGWRKSQTVRGQPDYRARSPHRHAHRRHVEQAPPRYQHRRHWRWCGQRLQRQRQCFG